MKVYAFLNREFAGDTFDWILLLPVIFKWEEGLDLLSYSRSVTAPTLVWLCCLSPINLLVETFRLRSYITFPTTSPYLRFSKRFFCKILLSILRSNMLFMGLVSTALGDTVKSGDTIGSWFLTMAIFLSKIFAPLNTKCSYRFSIWSLTSLSWFLLGVKHLWVSSLCIWM